jgi:TonB-linked SusC/RagA family outer membrane protein
MLFVGCLTSYAQDSLEVSRPDGGILLKAQEVGATSVIQNGEYGTFPDLTLTNMLQGKVLGLQIQSTVSGLGNNTPDLYIRGQHGMANNTAIVIVDGAERPLVDLIPEEIERIEILKDATAKILFGTRAANGVIMVTTRRGITTGRKYNVTAEAGIVQMTRTPEFLNSYQYANLYNEARANDGLTPYYNSAQLEGYRNSQGVNDLLYPNANHYKEFLNANANYRKVSFDVTGGTERVRYSLVAGYVGSSGFEKVGETPQLNRLTLRGNLDFDVTDFLTVTADVAGRMESRTWGQLDCASMFTALSNQRPNEYPFTMSPEDTGLTSSADGVPIFGGSLLRPMNVYAETMYGGYTDERYTRSQSNFGMNLDLDMVTKGLKAGAFLTFDNYDYLQLSLSKVYPTYDIDIYRNLAGDEEISYTQLKKLAVSTSQTRNSTTLQQTLGWNAFAAYQRSIDKHDVEARLAYQYTKSTNQGVTQDVINANYTLRLNYLYNRRYALEADMALMGSNRFAPGNKFFPSVAGGLAWIVSNEDFLKGNDAVNFLKLKTSAGILGFDRSTDHLLYEKAWAQDGNFRFGTTANGVTAYYSTMSRLGNPNLKWEKAVEWNIGLEGSFLKNRLKTEVNYFRELHSDIIGSVDASYGGYIGNFTYQDNMGSVLNQGIEGLFVWTDQINKDWNYSVGVNFVWSKNKVLKWNQVLHGEEYRYTVGTSTDAMTGLVAQGLFGKDVPLSGHATQTFADYQTGDIAYQDINGDQIIDGRDVEELGNSFPRLTSGIDLSLGYKGWNLYLQGYFEMGVNAWATNAYYWNNEESKYSTLTLDRYHPTDNPTGSYPRLTTTAGENNFRNSSFWLKDASFFRFKNIELSYTFDHFTTSSIVKKIKVFARGTNLFVRSSVKDLDPELLDAGVTNYPVTRSFTGGVSFVF